jgi:hypothetical protein
MIYEETPTVASPDFPGHRLMLRLGVGLLLALALVLLMVLRDNARRSVLERIEQPSAVGDTHYLHLPDPLPVPPFSAVAALDGEPLYPVGYRRNQKRETDLVPVGRDEAVGVTIYQAPAKTKDEADKATEPTYFLKLAPGDFLKVRRRNASDAQ